MQTDDVVLYLIELIFSWRIILVAIFLAASYYIPRFIYSVDRQMKQNDRIIKLLEGIYAQAGGDLKKLFPEVDLDYNPNSPKVEEKPRTELEELKDMYDRNNITKAEYEKAKKEIEAKQWQSDL